MNISQPALVLPGRQRSGYHWRRLRLFSPWRSAGLYKYGILLSLGSSMDIIIRCIQQCDFYISFSGSDLASPRSQRILLRCSMPGAIAKPCDIVTPKLTANALITWKIVRRDRQRLLDLDRLSIYIFSNVLDWSVLLAHRGLPMALLRVYALVLTRCFHATPS